jgi:hypothetical protein
MKRYNWLVLLALALIVLSVIVYLIHYAIFTDPHHIFIYMVGDIAFVPIEVLLVTLIIHQLLSRREKRARLEKLNMVIGVFFSELGTNLLTRFSDYDPKLDEVRKKLIVASDWSMEEFSSVSKLLKHYDCGIDIQKTDLEDLRNLLMDERGFLVRLLENPSLLEHESFTQLLQAVFHLTEELESREDFKKLPDSDYAHLAGDIKRAYGLLINEWLDYMKYTKDNYPYLFSLAMRMNPFDQNASAIVR